MPPVVDRTRSTMFYLMYMLVMVSSLQLFMFFFISGSQGRLVVQLSTGVEDPNIKNFSNRPPQKLQYRAWHCLSQLPYDTVSIPLLRVASEVQLKYHGQTSVSQERIMEQRGKRIEGRSGNRPRI